MRTIIWTPLRVQATPFLISLPLRLLVHLPMMLVFNAFLLAFGIVTIAPGAYHVIAKGHEGQLRKLVGSTKSQSSGKNGKSGKGKQSKPGFCGGCFCIPEEDQECPEEVPILEYPQKVIDLFKYQTMTNSQDYVPVCDPIKGAPGGIQEAPMLFGSIPPCNQTTMPPGVEDFLHRPKISLSPDAVCGLKYDYTYVEKCTSKTGKSASSHLFADSAKKSCCPAKYEMITYANRLSAEHDGAFVTHEGPCALCSSSQDLAAYLETLDLGRASIECLLVGFGMGQPGDFDIAAAVACFQTTVGFTENCAKAWIANGLVTLSSCAEICGFPQVIIEDPNGPPPNCTLDPCLRCDEDNAGPLFRYLAGRTKRNSGLISNIARKCSEIAPITQQPCPTPQH